MANKNKPAKPKGKQSKTDSQSSGQPVAQSPSTTPLVAVIMGSQSDWDTMRHADETLTQFGVAHECKVISAHRSPSLASEFASNAENRGFEVQTDRKSTRLNSSHVEISYAVFCLKKKKKK